MCVVDFLELLSIISTLCPTAYYDLGLCVYVCGWRGDVCVHLVIAEEVRHIGAISKIKTAVASR